MGHALVLGILSNPDGTTLASGEGGEQIRFYQSNNRALELAPVLIDAISANAPGDPEQGRLTRLWPGLALMTLLVTIVNSLNFCFRMKILAFTKKGSRGPCPLEADSNLSADLVHLRARP